jgi:serine/threonine-protein kinase
VTPEQWSRVNALFHDGLSRPPAERVAWLASQTSDPDVAREVLELIKAHESDDAFLEAPAMGFAETAAAAPAPLLIGRVIGPYQVEREIGRGGMGVVYLARDTRLGRSVALKAVSRGSADAVGRARLQREARAAASLAHPGIATVYALEEEGADCYLITEFLQGRTLRDELVDGPLPYGRWRLVAIAIAEAVGAAHAQGLVHRDLKPENVMRTDTGAIKVLDFGLARETTQIGTGNTPTITQAGALVGTPGYMAPEQIRGQPLDARTDVFAIGVLLYELAAGVHPFGAGSASGLAVDGGGWVGAGAGDVLARIVSEDPPPLETCSVVPPEAAAIVARALAKDPQARPADGRALAELLRALPAPVLTSQPGAPGAASAPRLTPVPVPSGSHDLAVQERWWLTHHIAVAAFFAIVLVPAWLSWRDVEPKAVRLALRVLLLLAVAAGVSVRLHLCFVARYRVGALARERRLAKPWLMLTNAAFLVALAAAGTILLETHAATASFMLGLAAVHGVVAVMIEPSTDQAYTVPAPQSGPALPRADGP